MFAKSSMILLSILLALDVTVGFAQAPRNVGERLADRAELADDHAERRDDREDLAQVRALLVDLDRAASDPAALRSVDARAARLLGVELSESQQEAREANRELRRDRRELRSDRREIEHNRKTDAGPWQRADDRHDLRDDRRDRRDDRRDREREKSTRETKQSIAAQWKQLLGKSDGASIFARRELLGQWITLAEAEIAENAAELSEDKRELREDRRETREDRRQRRR